MREELTCLASDYPAKTYSLPSRHSNPFATCWTRPGSIPFRFDAGESVENLIRKLRSQRFQGSIIGPHGSGKSTLLETLKPRLRAAGWQVHHITLRDGQRRLPGGFYSKNATEGPLVAIVDGYEQLHWLERARLRRHCVCENLGLIVTSHTATRIPMLIRLAPTSALIQQIVDHLTARVSTDVTFNDVAASHARHGSNVRDLLFELYDVHERKRRSSRTPHCIVA